jgi:hypothetical protein
MGAKPPGGGLKQSAQADLALAVAANSFAGTRI